MVGRFLSPDPFVQNANYADGYNRYAYCLNNPLNYTDPSGYVTEASEKAYINSYWYQRDSHPSAPGGGGGVGPVEMGPDFEEYMISKGYVLEVNEYGISDWILKNEDNTISRADISAFLEKGFIIAYIGEMYGKPIIGFIHPEKWNGLRWDAALVGTQDYEVTVNWEAANVGDDWLDPTLKYSNKANGGLSAANGAREVVEWEYIRQARINRALSRNYSHTIKHSMRAIKAVGKFTGVASAGMAWADYANNPTTGNLIQAIANTGLTFARVNPFTGILIGLADVTGASDYIFDKMGGFIDDF